MVTLAGIGPFISLFSLYYNRLSHLDSSSPPSRLDEVCLDLLPPRLSSPLCLAVSWDVFLLLPFDLEADSCLFLESSKFNA